MSRVMKKFLGKVLPPFGIMLYIAAVMVGSTMVGGTAAFFGPVVFLVIPLFVYILYESYKDAKREVEWEDRDLLKDIKSNV